MNEKQIAKLFRAKGYKYGCQFTLKAGAYGDPEHFGAPLYFKAQEDIEPFMKENGLEVLWTKHIEELI